MNKKTYVLISFLCFVPISIIATTIQVVNSTDPKKDILIKFDQKVNVPLKWPDKDGFYTIKDSQIITPPSLGLKTIFWKYEAAGQEFKANLKWGFFDIGKFYIFSNGQAVETSTAKTRNLLITHLVDTGKKIALDAHGAITSTAQYLATPIKNTLKQQLPAITDNSHKNDSASLRNGTVMGKDELAFRNARLPLVKATQEKLMGIKMAAGQEPLEIAIAFSGGGVRALYSTLGALVALQMLDLINTVMTISSLSGSTWALFPWMQGDPVKKEILPVKTFLQSMLNRFEKDIWPTGGLELEKTAEGFKEIAYITNMLLTKFCFDQPVNPILDLYGGLLANKVYRQFGEKRQMVYISEMAASIKTGKYPLPIGTAIESSTKKEGGMENVFEVNPFEAGIHRFSDSSFFVPTWAFGRKFKDAKSIDFAPEQPAGFFLGTFGSAMAISGKDAYKHMIKNSSILPPFFKQAYDNYIANTALGTLSAVWSEAFNFLPEGNLYLKDAGIAMGCPVFSCYRRPAPKSPDIIFVFDNSATVGAEELYKHAKYAEANQLKYPLKTSDFTKKSGKWEFNDENLQKNLNKQSLNVYESANDITVPTVVYITRIVDKTIDYAAFDVTNAYNIPAMKMTLTGTDKEYETFNLKYSTQQAERLSKLAELNVRGNAKALKDVMVNRWNRKKAATVKKT